MSEPEKAANKPDSPDTPGDTTRTDAEDWIAVGEVVGTFGVRGQLKVAPLTAFPERFAHTPTVYVGKKRSPYHVLDAHPHKRHILLQLEDVVDLDAAERLRGAILWIPAGQIATLPDDQFYVHDLIGMRVFHVNGTHLGVVTDVLAMPGNDLFVIRTPDGSEALLPAVKAFVRAVDTPARVITVDPIPGLFDEQAEVADK